MKSKTMMKPEQSLMRELVLLEDDFAEHVCVSAFVLAALPAVMSCDDAQQPEVVAGAKLCADMIQARTKELKQRLDHACERYRDEH